MQADGAHIIDVGGESTRPGFAEVEAKEELRRTIPVVEALARELSIPVSIDTYKASVAKAAIEAGAALVNDVHGFLREPEIAGVAAKAGVPAIAMYYHRGRVFKDTIGNIVEGLLESFAIAREQGLLDEQIIIDPGFNFGWTDDQALEMLRRLGELHVLRRPMLVGTSRKSTIGKVLGDLPVEDRLEGTAATVAISIANGADIVRVHDVKEMARVAKMADAVVRGWKR
jgi:dihydropteroate synthase